MTSPLTIALVTPSFNQGSFLEDTLRSVLDQNYPALEYVVMDGGSTDQSVDIIRRYESGLTCWASEKDQGPYDAVNKGFARTTGEIMGWLNSDDKHCPWTLSVVAEIFQTFPQIQWLTTGYPLFWDRLGRAVLCYHISGFNQRAFYRGLNLYEEGWKVSHCVQQESTFWRRSLWEAAGGYVDTSSPAGDFELWCRFFKHASPCTVYGPIAGFRVHGDQISVKQRDRYWSDAKALLQKHGGRAARGPLRFMRDAMSILNGRRAYAWPGMGKLLSRVGVLYPVDVCIWIEGKWELHRLYQF